MMTFHGIHRQWSRKFIENQFLLGLRTDFFQYTKTNKPSEITLIKDLN